MISYYQLKNNLLMDNDSNDKFFLREHDMMIIDKTTNKEVCTFNHFYEVFTEIAGCSFESIYRDPLSLTNVLRCKKCGTIIFSKDNYEDYDPNLLCPICTDYKTNFTYWTKEDIETDVDKQKMVNYYEELVKIEEELEERRKRRKGKFDDEISRFKIHLFKLHLKCTLKCFNITESYFKGLHFKIEIFKENNEFDGSFLVLEGTITIPLSISFYKFLKEINKE